LPPGFAKQNPSLRLRRIAMETAPSMAPARWAQPALHGDFRLRVCLANPRELLTPASMPLLGCGFCKAKSIYPPAADSNGNSAIHGARPLGATRPPWRFWAVSLLCNPRGSGSAQAGPSGTHARLKPGCHYRAPCRPAFVPPRGACAIQFCAGERRAPMFFAV
jgi:hypothetical protein